MANKKDKEKIKQYCHNKFRKEGFITRDEIEKCMVFITAWKEEQMIQKAFSVMKDIYEQYGHNPQDCEELFKKAMKND